MRRFRVIAPAAVIFLFAVLGAYLIFSHGTAAQARSFDLRVTGDSMSPKHLTAVQGDSLRVAVTADRLEEIHIHGYERRFFTRPGDTQVQTFPADRTGTFDVEIHKDSGEHVVIGTLEVRPATGGLLGGAGQQAAQAPTMHHHTTISQILNTQRYSFLLKLQPLRGTSITETVLAGSLQEVPADSAGFRLAVHVYNRSTGKAEPDLAPEIQLTDDLKAATNQVPLAVLQAPDAGPADIHYGNNVLMPPSRYTIRVAVGQDVAVFKVAT